MIKISINTIKIKIILKDLLFWGLKINSFSKYVNIVNKSKKLPILENVVIIPIVINTTNNLIYIFKKKLFEFVFLSLFNDLRTSRDEIKLNNKNTEKTVLLTKKPVEESL